MFSAIATEPWMLLPLTALMIPIIAIIGAHFSAYLQRRERMAAREMYERLAREKLDVIRTAVAMGQDDDEISRLDERLERLIGSRELKKLLGKQEPGVPDLNYELENVELTREITKVKKKKERAAGE